MRLSKDTTRLKGQFMSKMCCVCASIPTEFGPIIANGLYQKNVVLKCQRKQGVPSVIFTEAIWYSSLREGLRSGRRLSGVADCVVSVATSKAPVKCLTG